MFSDRCRIDAIARSCSGHASGRHTMVASTSARYERVDGPSHDGSAAIDAIIVIVSSTMGTESAAADQNRRVMSRNSLDGPSSATPLLGSSAIPQIGHEP